VLEENEKLIRETIMEMTISKEREPLTKEKIEKSVEYIVKGNDLKTIMCLLDIDEHSMKKICEYIQIKG